MDGCADIVEKREYVIVADVTECANRHCFDIHIESSLQEFLNRLGSARVANFSEGDENLVLDPLTDVAQEKWLYQDWCSVVARKLPRYSMALFFTRMSVSAVAVIKCSIAFGSFEVPRI